jgi:DNA (cytosine-5)-methyltransferase 1
VIFGSICSGIEAASVAWAPLGWRPAFFAEIDKFPCVLLRHHYAETPNLGDVTRFKDWPDAAINVLVGGTPCQSFSVAGDGVCSLSDILETGDVPRRFFLSARACRGILRRAEKRGKELPIQLRRALEMVAGLPAPTGNIVEAFGGNRQSGELDVATAINAHGGPHGRLDFESETFVAHSLRAEGFDASEDGTGRGTPLIAFDCKAGAKTGFAIGDTPGALRGEGHGGGHAAVAFQPRIGRNGRGYAEDVVPALNGADAGATSDMRPCVAFATSALDSAREDGASPPLKAMMNGQGTGAGPSVLLSQGWAVRRLTPLECERLQGFPDNYTAIPYRGKPAADGPRYKALGNSMAVNVMRWIGRRIQMVEGIA